MEYKPPLDGSSNLSWHVSKNGRAYLRSLESDIGIAQARATADIALRKLRRPEKFFKRFNPQQPGQRVQTSVTYIQTILRILDMPLPSADLTTAKENWAKWMFRVETALSDIADRLPDGRHSHNILRPARSSFEDLLRSGSEVVEKLSAMKESKVAARGVASLIIASEEPLKTVLMSFNDWETWKTNVSPFLTHLQGILDQPNQHMDRDAEVDCAILKLYDSINKWRSTLEVGSSLSLPAKHLLRQIRFYRFGAFLPRLSFRLPASSPA